jgi:zinc transport system substrate-binding protein
MKRRPPSRAAATLAALPLLVLAAMPAAAGGEPLRVGVSVAPIGWLVEAVGGDAVKVLALAQPGDSAETFQPSDAQVSGLLRARLFFRIGLPFEDSPSFRALLAERTLAMVDLRHGLELHQGLELLEHDHGSAAEHADHHGDDPHFWLSPRRLMVVARTIESELARADPGQAARYRAGADGLVARLDALDTELRLRLAPFRDRPFFVYHPEWSYFAADYGLRQIAIERDGKEPTERELTRLIVQARIVRAGTIFVQPQIAGRGARALAEAIGGRVVVLDALSPEIPKGLETAADLLIESFTPKRVISSDIRRRADTGVRPYGPSHRGLLP